MRNLLMVMALALVQLACGPGPEGIFRGTTTQTFVGATPAITTGDLVFMSPSVQPGQVVIEAIGLGFTATLQGQTLTFQPNQAATLTDARGSSSTTLTMGTGTLNGNQLSLNLSVATSQMAPGGMPMPSSYTLTFTGERL
jgi:hypothetical protein